MIVASILLILVAVVLLVAGLASGSSPLLIASIAASLLAAVALVAGARQVAANRTAADRMTGPRIRTGPSGPLDEPWLGEPEIPDQHNPSTVGTGGSGWRQPSGPPVADPYAPPPEAHTPFVPPGPREPAGDGAGSVPDAPVPTSPAAGDAFGFEPPAQPLSPAQTDRLAGIFADVRVVDGHPRFHLPDCPHLMGWDDEPLPVGEAVQMGFTPCADCAPVTALLPDLPPDRSW
ncbi:hypothetical protein ACNAW0_19410 [Micromonospora sp. SL1-18]|uniref:hypothetical protein n=1 Tax=Micromonospora sp. SL1-18 TaxID=3399128 RepID=UPI003A4D7A46